MTMFVLQVAFFIAVAFGLGCLFGCWLKGRMGSSRHRSGAAAAVTHEGAARAATAGELAAQIPHYEPQSSPPLASAFAPQPVSADNPASVAAGAPVDAKPAPAKRSTKPKAPRSSAGKPAAPKATASKAKAKATRGRSEKAKADKPAAAKSAAVKPKLQKTSPVEAPVPDNLKQIKGIGPQIEAKLNAVGINSFAQIAAWGKKQQAEFAEQLSFAGRIEREQWVSQAKILAKGGSTDFAKRVAKGEVASSADKPKRGGKA